MALGRVKQSWVQKQATRRLRLGRAAAGAAPKGVDIMTAEVVQPIWRQPTAQGGMAGELVGAA
jgi:hypothetical protein